MSLIHSHNVTLLRARFPEFDQGAADVRAGHWREIVGDYESMAYEIGRMLALEPPKTTLLGMLVMSPFVERAFRQLVAC